MRHCRFLLWIPLVILLAGCDDHPWNSPYPHHTPQKKRMYTSFSEQPKTLDPAKSYTMDEARLTYLIYEPVVQYDPHKRPYVLIPLTAKQVPTVTLLDTHFHALPQGTPPDRAAYTQYDVVIRPGILYQPHPAFSSKSNPVRELIANDYVYQIKRLAHPMLNAPLLGLMEKYIVGLSDYVQQLHHAYQKGVYLDLNRYPLKGVSCIDRYHYRIRIKGYYPQFMYWLTTPFFAPIPWEVDRFYATHTTENRHFDWNPVGTGPFMLTENDPNRRMVLTKNPHYHRSDLPRVDEIHFMLEKESMPRWHKFLQGYYDQSAISSDSFDQAIRLDAQGQPQLTPSLQKHQISLQKTVEHSTFYTGFNMQDPIVGGYSARARALRQAISIAIDSEQWIQIFYNGRGIAAQGPIPPGIFGYQSGKSGMNPYIYTWKDNHIQRKSIDVAKKLLAKAGYAGGIDHTTGKPLVLYYDTSMSASSDSKSRFDWLRQQFRKLHIQLQIRATQYHRFQQKIATGNVQIFFLGWVADYPDPENFLMLLYGPHSTVPYGGANHMNYHNALYDQLFHQMKWLPNGPKRLQLIQQMLDIIRRDAPVIWCFHPMNLTLNHQWVDAVPPDDLIRNTAKYLDINAQLRDGCQKAWNRPVVWPLGVFFLVVMGLMLTAVRRHRRKMRS